LETNVIYPSAIEKFLYFYQLFTTEELEVYVDEVIKLTILPIVIYLYNIFIR